MKIRTNRRHDLAIIGAGIAQFLHFILLLAICHASDDDVSTSGSEDSTSQDNNGDSGGYDDDTSEEYGDDDAVYQSGTWIADDVYYPSDDYFYPSDDDVQELNSDLNAMNDENEIPIDMHDLLMKFLAGSFSMLGLASAVFCTAIFLYFLRVDGLMRRYSKEGMPVDGRIVASVPDIQEIMKKSIAEEEKKIAFADKIQNMDSYSMMTDDDSYQFSKVSEYSGSDGSIEEGQKSNTSSHHAKDLEAQQQQRLPISGANSAQTSTAKSARRPSSLVLNEKTKIPAGRGKFQAMSFRVMLEYDDVTYHDVISQKSSEIIRKRLLVTGEDVIEPAKNSSNPQQVVKMRVLKGLPMSGHPCGEVRRAVRWQKRLSFNVYILLGIALVVGGAIVAQRMLPSIFLYVYIGFIIMQVPILHWCLDGSFEKIISDRYLENGLRLPVANSKKRLKEKEKIEKEKMITALKKGTSFSFV